MSPHLHADLINSNSLEIGRAAERSRRQGFASKSRSRRARVHTAGRFQLTFARVAARHG